jgi:hypothetical protein
MSHGNCTKVTLALASSSTALRRCAAINADFEITLPIILSFTHELSVDSDQGKIMPTLGRNKGIDEALFRLTSQFTAKSLQK